MYFNFKVWYNYYINKDDSVKLDGCRLDAGAVPAASTINTFTKCAYDGGEIGSTDARRQRRITKVNANDNFAPEMRLAA